MLPTDEKWMMVEDEFNSIASTFTRHLHAEEYKKLKKLAAQKSVKTVADLPRPTDSITTLSKEAQMRKQAEKKREQMKKAASKHPGHNEPAGSDEEETPMLFIDRHLAGLMQASPGARAPKRILHTDSTKSHTRAAAGFTKQDDGATLRPKERQRLPDLGDFMKSRRAEVKVREQSPTPLPKATKRREELPPKRKEIPVTREDNDDDEDDLDAIVPLSKVSGRSLLQPKSSSLKSLSTIMAPPLRDKPANLHRESSSTSSQSQKTYPRPALRRESSSAGSPPKKTTFSEMSTQSSARHISRSTITRPAASLATEQNNGEFAFMDLPVARSRLLPTRRGPRYGPGAKQPGIKEEKVVKLEEVPYF